MKFFPQIFALPPSAEKFLFFCKNPLLFLKGCVIIIKLFLGVAQLVARYLGVVEAGCSSHLTQTITGHQF